MYTQLLWFSKRVKLSNRLFRQIVAQFPLSIKSIHGIDHWKRVESIGLGLSKMTGADPKVIVHFAYLHDSRRFDEYDDPLHGQRASQFIDKLLKTKSLDLSPTQIKQLQTACRSHSDHRFTTNDITIATCLDADRLDLVRLGIQPKADFIHTNPAKSYMKN
ncbi:hypothetical protein A2572_02475 [Candidatus Collierbacteria bacterium RIFOXYD1_FULL_40_9]|uniref:HD domain-containing protein n=1 Tax=Candidatus Collierbacteria bacterium RIFOXYD1_FULL_40_9 TaxID=1817731 RepID=A0A1F5FPB8_9BACT|nr:MAG: hypothetical protein A2572_02475 [Candidatus Collierbacteria bacterium RIFOXYD1_FULL_40_9]